MRLTRLSPCKVNLLLNILGRRPDGFHELETVMQPVPVWDELEFRRGGDVLCLTCSDPALPTDEANLVHRAATSFLGAARITEGVRIHLEKRLPLAAGLGGGSANAATTLRALNELFGHPLAEAQLYELAARLGSDVPFFLQDKPALATGRGERVAPLDPFPALRGAWVMLVHPGFGISTAWAYQRLAQFPAALHGRPGRAQELIERLQSEDLGAAARHFSNSLEAPVLGKYPVLALYQEFLRSHGAAVALMSGSGSSTFALFRDRETAEPVLARFASKFGERAWTALAKL